MYKNWDKIGEFKQVDSDSAIDGQSLICFTELSSFVYKLKSNSELDLVYFVYAKDDQAKSADVVIEYLGEGVKARVIVLVLAKDRSKIELNLKSVGNRNYNEMHAICKVVTFDQAVVNVKGMMTAEEGTKGNDLYYAHHSLIMSDKSEAVSFPGLEIKTDDIKAAHSASLGRIDEDVLFYMNCRGFETSEAEKIVVGGFLNEYVDLLKDDELKSYLSGLINDNLQ